MSIINNMDVVEKVTHFPACKNCRYTYITSIDFTNDGEMYEGQEVTLAKVNRACNIFNLNGVKNPDCKFINESKYYNMNMIYYPVQEVN